MNSKKYECVYYFLDDSTQPKKKTDKSYKLVPRDFYLENKLTNIKRIQQFKYHFYVPLNNYNLTINELDDYDSELNGTHLQNDKTTLLLEFDNIELTNLKSYLLLTHTPQQYISDIIHFYTYLLSSIDLLVQHQLVFNSISFENIYIDNYNTPLLANFSLSLNISHDQYNNYMKHFILAYDPEYIEWPLEFHLLAYIQTNKLKSISYFNIESVVNDVIKNHYILASFGEKIVSSYRTKALEYYSKYINKSFEYILTDATKYYDTWDNYSLSILFLKILINIHNSIHTKNKFIILFMKLLVCNINASPLERHSIKDTLQQFNSIVDQTSVSQFFELFKRLS